MNDIFDVRLSKNAEKNLKKIPLFIAIKLEAWIEAIGYSGLSEIRKISGYHDEPLKGKRKGQRSIRLNKKYRAIYTVNKDIMIDYVEVQEINKHDY